MTVPKKVQSNRQAMLAKVHLAKKELGLPEESYRDVLECVTGKRSAGQLNEAQLDLVIEAFKREGWKPGGQRQPKRAGSRPIAGGPVAAKARALWLSLYHLGEVSDPSEKALDAFVKRQLGLGSLRWLPAEQCSSVVEALKAWCERAGVDWSPYAVANGPSFRAPKARIIEAQWRRLHALGAVAIDDLGALASWLHRRGFTPGIRDAAALDDATADQAMEQLGKWLRRRLKENGGRHGA